MPQKSRLGKVARLNKFRVEFRVYLESILPGLIEGCIEYG